MSTEPCVKQVGNLRGKSNCFFFALKAWFRWKNKGAYWAVRKLREERNWIGLHWLVNYKGRWIHFEPISPKETIIESAIHKLWYEGTIKRTDAISD